MWDFGEVCISGLGDGVEVRLVRDFELHVSLESVHVVKNVLVRKANSSAKEVRTNITKRRKNSPERVPQISTSICNAVNIHKSRSKTAYREIVQRSGEATYGKADSLSRSREPNSPTTTTQTQARSTAQRGAGGNIKRLGVLAAAPRPYFTPQLLLTTACSSWILPPNTRERIIWKYQLFQSQPKVRNVLRSYHRG